MTVTFTLGSIYTGTTFSAGPFNIFAVTNLGVSTQVGTDISKTDLANGVTISGIDDSTTGGTINSTGVCTNDYPWYVSTPEPTEPAVSATCWSLTYDLIPGLPSDLYVRYRDTTGEVVTVLITTGTLSQENGDGTATSVICVNTEGAYNEPVFVQGGLETSYSVSWVEGDSCEGPATCLIS